MRPAIDMLRSLRASSRLKGSRHLDDMIVDRITQAASAPTLIAMGERLAQLLQSDTAYVGGDTIAAWAAYCASEDAPRALRWIRDQPRTTALLLRLRDEDDLREALTCVDLDDQPDVGVVRTYPDIYDVRLTIDTLAPLAHGADDKAGNATLFRRQQFLTSTGATARLPIYAGNALRGQIRDALADHFLASLGITPDRRRPPVALWLFHALYAGGILEEKGKQQKGIDKQLGANGAEKIGGHAQLRGMLIPLSLLGVALGNRIICGRIQVADCRPSCAEFGTGSTPVHQLFDWHMLTRREDHEGRQATDAHHGMIAYTECIMPGTTLHGGIDIDSHASDIERACLARGLTILADRGVLGAESRRGFGKVRIQAEGLCDPDAYDQHLALHRDAIVEFLRNIGGLAKEEETEAADHAHHDASGAESSIF
jgi:hypothetical protein